MSRRALDEDYMFMKGWASADFGKRNAALDSQYAALERRFFARSNSIIELGFGGGYLLSFLRERNRRVIGYEISEPLVEKAVKNGYDAYTIDQFTTDRHQPIAVDAIIALDVFEHMNDETILTIMQAVRKSLKPDGKLVIRTPNAASPLGIHYQFSDWTHVTMWSPPYADHCARRSGLVLTSITGEFDFPAATGLKGILHRLRNLALKSLEWIMQQTLYRGSSFRLSPNLYFEFTLGGFRQND
jgi:SAM-dependent methyltransferase